MSDPNLFVSIPSTCSAATTFAKFDRTRPLLNLRYRSTRGLGRWGGGSDRLAGLAPAGRRAVLVLPPRPPLAATISRGVGAAVYTTWGGGRGAALAPAPPRPAARAGIVIAARVPGAKEPSMWGALLLRRLVRGRLRMGRFLCFVGGGGILWAKVLIGG